jgi:hypothetical protein
VIGLKSNGQRDKSHIGAGASLFFSSSFFLFFIIVTQHDGVASADKEDRPERPRRHELCSSTRAAARKRAAQPLGRRIRGNEWAGRGVCEKIKQKSKRLVACSTSI